MIRPHWIYKKVATIPLTKLWQEGYRGILLDIDDTLVPKYERVVSEQARGWVDQAKGIGFRLVIVSNTFFPRRIRKIATRLELPYIPLAGKPLPLGMLWGLFQLRLPPRHVVMVGDQLLTDIVGANLLGIRSLYVPPLSTERTRFKQAIRGFEQRFL